MSEPSGKLRQNSSARSRFSELAIPLLMLAAVTFLAFANAWPDRLIFDDKAFAGPDRAPVLDSLHYMFTSDVWAVIGADGGLYRPLLLLDLSLESRILGDWLAGYHLSNILLHFLVSFLVFGFLRYLLRSGQARASRSELCALLAAMIFAVHPVHAEVVNSVFNRSEMMVAVFGVAGLWWLLHYLDSRPLRAWMGLAVLYFLSMLSRESAVSIPGLAVLLILLYSSGDLAARIRKCLPVFWLLIPLAIYLAMRFYALSRPEAAGAAPATDLAETGSLLNLVTLPDSETFLDVAGVLGRSLQLVLWPYPLRLHYPNPSVPVLVIYVALQLALIVAALILLKKGRAALAAGLGFYYIAILPATRILGMDEAGPHLADRYLYFPSVGLTLILAFGFGTLARRFSPRALLAAGMPLLLVLTALTWERNGDWVSEISLFETEYRRGHYDTVTERLITSAYIKAGNFSRVVEICDENPEDVEESGDSPFVMNCATAYERLRRYDDTERAHRSAIRHKSTRVSASLSLAQFYLRRDRPEEARAQFEAAIEWAESPAEKALFTAEMIVGLNPANPERWVEARNYAEEALRLKPGWERAERALQGIIAALDAQEPN